MIRRLRLPCATLRLTPATSLSPAGEHVTPPFFGGLTAAWHNRFLDELFTPTATFVGGGPVTHLLGSGAEGSDFG
jgi:hypothetical protein